MPVTTIAVLGGDRRTACMIPFLENMGCRVLDYGLAQERESQDTKELSKSGCECKSPVRSQCSQYSESKVPKSLSMVIEQADVIVGGIPLFKDSAVSQPQLLEAIRKTGWYHSCSRRRKMLFGGVIGQDFRDEMDKMGVVCYDFMKEESIAVFNTIATAEGTIVEAIRNKDTNLHGSECIVLGYGRCAKVLARKLKGMDALVTVCCRSREALAMAGALGCGVLPLENLGKEIWKYEYIFNTIPQVVLQEPLLRKTAKDVLIVDIASGAGGVDYDAARRLRVHALLCPGLPGKVAPVSSAQVLAEYVMAKVSGNQ